MRVKARTGQWVVCLHILALASLGACTSGGRASREVVGLWEAEREALEQRHADTMARAYIAARSGARRMAEGERAGGGAGDAVGDELPVVPEGQGLKEVEARYGSEASEGLLNATRSTADEMELRLTLDLRPDQTFTLLSSFDWFGRPAEHRSAGMWRRNGALVLLEGELTVATPEITEHGGGPTNDTGPWSASLRLDETRLVQTEGTIRIGIDRNQQLAFLRAAESGADDTR